MDSSQPAAPKPVCRAHKFGGSSLADAARIRRVADLMLDAPEPVQVVVASAMQGVTDALIALAEHGSFTNATPLLQQTLGEEQRMAQWVYDSLPQISLKYVSLRAAGETAGH